MKKNKYLYGWKLCVNYGQGWEYEYFTDSYREYRGIRRDYIENCKYPQKWTKARELNN
jgi:hypothetical protein